MRNITFIILLLLPTMGMAQEKPPQGKLPAFTLAWSEWPGWSIFGVADELGLINGAEGKLGSVEEKWGVDIVLKEMDYDPCITAYGNGAVDAACLTNMDSLPPSLTRETAAILICDTSEGGDMWITTSAGQTWESLKGSKAKVYGLQNSVSHYVGVRLLERHGLTEDDIEWVNMDPGAAAIAMQQGNLSSIVVWNPFCLQVLQKNKKARVFGSSKEIPGEVMDLVVASQEALDRPGGKGFVMAVLEAYYGVMDRLGDKETQDDTLASIGAKFSRLPLEEMRKILEGTKYIMSPAEAADFFTSPDCSVTMGRVVEFCMSHLDLPKRPGVAVGTREKVGKVNFRFDPSYLQEFARN